MERICKNCKAFKALDKKVREPGECRMNAPKAIRLNDYVVQTIFPKVEPLSWCLKFISKDELKEGIEPMIDMIKSMRDDEHA